MIRSSDAGDSCVEPGAKAFIRIRDPSGRERGSNSDRADVADSATTTPAQMIVLDVSRVMSISGTAF